MAAKRGPKPSESQFKERVHLSLTEAQIVQVRKLSKQLGTDRSKVIRTALANMEHQLTFDEMVKRLEGNIRKNQTTASPQGNKEALEAAKQVRFFLKHYDHHLQIVELQSQLFAAVGFTPNDRGKDLRTFLETDTPFEGEWQIFVNACARKLLESKTHERQRLVEIMTGIRKLGTEDTIKTLAMASPSRARYVVGVLFACQAAMLQIAKKVEEIEGNVKSLEQKLASMPDNKEPNPPTPKRKLWPF